MLRLHGPRESEEWAAGESLRNLILASTPAIGTSPHYDVNIIVSAQTPGQRSRVSDIDLVILAKFARPWSDRFMIRQVSGAEVAVDVWSIAATIEVKSHDPSGVMIQGNHAYVQYREGWHDATLQSMRQREALREYLTANLGSSPYIVNLLWLRGVVTDQLAELGLPHPTNIMPADLTFYTLLDRIVNLNLPVDEGSSYIYGLQNYKSLDASRAISLLTRRIEPSSLDRKKTEQITTGRLDLAWMESAGSVQVILRGPGGSGKTIALLRAAYNWYQDGLRILILTYNNALVADLRRQMAILQIGQDIASPSIRVMTVHSFMMSISNALIGKDDASIDSEWFESAYPKRLSEVSEFIKGGAINQADVENAFRMNDSELGWDFICVDEGQDWMDAERDLLHLSYGAQRLVIAEGRDQLVRQHSVCNWALATQKASSKVIRLNKVLRMKSNLVTFANTLAANLDLMDWHLDGSLAIPGGRVIIRAGSRFDESVQKQLTKENAVAGNRNIDMLYCMLSPEESSGADISEKVMPLPELMRNWGYEVWNGTDKNQRFTFPTSIDQCRIVQFDSSRGLEGWTVILNELDMFFDYKRELWRRENGEREDAMSREESAKLFSALWCMIPITRAIDTLAITIQDPGSTLGQAVLQVAHQLPDIVFSA